MDMGFIRLRNNMKRALIIVIICIISIGLDLMIAIDYSDIFIVQKRNDLSFLIAKFIIEPSLFLLVVALEVIGVLLVINFEKYFNKLV